MTPTTRVYLLSGMTPDERIFERLVPLLPSCIVMEWFPPSGDEPIVDFARRIAETIPTNDCFIGGVSFGGIVALEVSRIIRPRGCFLISSIRNPRQLPPWLRIWRGLAKYDCQRVFDSVGRFAQVVPRQIRTRSTSRITKFAGDDGAWHRWATSAVLRWQPDAATPGVPVCQIHGDCDTTFPIRYTNPDVVVHNGGHVLPLTHPTEVANAMLAAIAREG